MKLGRVRGGYTPGRCCHATFTNSNCQLLLWPSSALLTLTLRGFSRQEFADKHHEGWDGCLLNLARFVDGGTA